MGRNEDEKAEGEGDIEEREWRELCLLWMDRLLFVLSRLYVS